MNRSLKSFARDFLPPVMLRMLKAGSDFGWSGNYQTWEDALRHCAGYNAPDILAKVKEATLKVKNGEAVYERDSVIFDAIEYSWPLLSFLMWVAAKNGGAIKTIDFGGALGSSYFQNRKFLADLNVQWNVVEQSTFVECGRQFIQDERIQFFTSIKESISAKGIPDLVVISCTLPYIENPFQLLDEIMSYEIPYLVIDNTPFNYEKADRLTVQKVNPPIYNASYPCWFLNYDSVKSQLSKKYTIHTEYENDLYIILDRHHIQNRGIFVELK